MTLFRKTVLLAVIIATVDSSLPPSVTAQAQAPQVKSFKAYPGKDWSKEKLAREAFSRHRFNKQRIQRQVAEGLRPESSGPTVTDTADVSVIQDDGSILIPANPFSLTGRSVLFTPSGNAYTVTAGASAYDTNFGTKLSLTTSPAVNPKFGVVSGVELGDDAYIVQPLGFNFTYYGVAYSNVAVSSNGFLTFRPGSLTNQYFDDNSVDSGEALSALQLALPRIAPYWHDLDARSVSTAGTNGIYLRTDVDKVVVTWNNIPDFPNSVSDNGVQRFQAILFSDGRIQFNYSQIQLTSTSIVGISGGANSPSSTLVDFANPANPTPSAYAPLAEIFTVSPAIDEISAVAAFYTAHPGTDVFDFVHVFLDFNYTLSGNAFAYYAPIRNSILGNGQGTFDGDPYGLIGGTKVSGVLQLGSLNSQYPAFPTIRIPAVGANHFLSVMGQEQGHYWLAYVTYPLVSSVLLLGRDNEHWSFFLNTETSWSQPAAPRSSCSEGSVWKNNGNGTFTSAGLIDGYSKLDQYLMGLRPAAQVPDSFAVINATAPFGVNRSTSPTPNLTITGTSYTTSINSIIQANGQVSPAADGTQKKYRAAVLLIEQKGQQTTQASLDKLTRYRLAWESYFAQSTDYLATMNTGLAPLNYQRFIAVTNGASFAALTVPGEICSIFGQGLTDGTALAATPGQSLPNSLAGVEVRVDGVVAPLFYAGPYQVNFQMPRATSATTTIAGSGTVQSATSTVEVYRNSQLIRASAVLVAPVQISTFSITQDGVGAAAALDAITFAPGPFNAKQANGQPNYIAAYVTGLGADVTDVAGDVAAGVQATLSGQPLTVQYAGQAPGYVGLNQINFQLPAVIAPGTYDLTLSRLGYAGNTTTITIK